MAKIPALWVITKITYREIYLLMILLLFWLYGYSGVCILPNQMQNIALDQTNTITF